MRFQLDHDWQGNMSTPRAHLGDSVKIQLLLALCFIWVLLGLTGHAPWKPLESTGINIVKNILDQSYWLATLTSDSTALENPPIYYLSASASAHLLSPWLAIHDGARLINALWLSLMLLMVGMSGRELWGNGAGRHATLIMLGSIGLVVSAHSLMAEIAGLTASAIGFYALALIRRRPIRGCVLLASALCLGFLSYGLITALALICSAVLLSILFKRWRNLSFIKLIIAAILLSSLPITLWLAMLHQQHLAVFNAWWLANLNGFNHSNHLYFLRILIWYAWPALPLALLGLWHYRQRLYVLAPLQLILVFFFCHVFLLGYMASAKDINALALLLPLSVLAAGSVEHLKRGMAAALNWFGVLLFGLIGGLIWLGYLAMMTGYPSKIKQRMVFLSGAEELHFSYLALTIALIVTAVWLFVCIRARQSNKSTVSNWAVGMTFAWALLMTLWLPLLDSAKSYRPVFTSLDQRLSGHNGCINSLNVERQQSLLLNYYSGIRLMPVASSELASCDYLLVFNRKGKPLFEPDTHWQTRWSGKRPADRKESFYLYQRN
ncbi:MAG: glycosyl transferase [Methylotenera sp.]|nr:glycosyl transferase [Methylotenera sp.]